MTHHHQANQILGKTHLQLEALALAGLIVLHQAHLLTPHQVGIDPYPVGLNWNTLKKETTMQVLLTEEEYTILKENTNAYKDTLRSYADLLVKYTELNSKYYQLLTFSVTLNNEKLKGLK